jgi:DNA-binding transcriptional regulator YhcF (GntR family)
MLNRASLVPLHRQLHDQLAPAIRTSPAGTRLPSTRVLARLLGVSRNTVLAVYDDLAADGLIEGRRGAAMVVAGRAALPPGPLDMPRLFREAGYPARAIVIVDADGNLVSLTY